MQINSKVRVKLAVRLNNVQMYYWCKVALKKDSSFLYCIQFTAGLTPLRAHSQLQLSQQVPT